MIDALTHFDAPDNLRFLFKPIRGDEYGDGLTYRFGLRVAENPLCALVPARNNPIKILADNRVVRRIDNRAEKTIRTFRALKMRRVAGNFRGSDDLAANVSYRRDRQRDIDQAAILAPSNRLDVIDALTLFNAPDNLRFLLRAAPGG